MKYVRRKQINQIISQLEKGWELKDGWLVDLKGKRIITLKEFRELKTDK